ncbi:MAG: cyclodeaminase/cyclohydrolase family protein [Chloroflexota bacterium]
MPTDPGSFATLSVQAFTDRLASSDPTPGGGSAAAVAASLAASLTAMVARLSADRPKYAPYAATHAHALEVAEAARARLLALADEDAAAYDAFGAARRLPKETPEEVTARTAAIAAAAVRAAEIPLEVVRQCHALVHEIESLAGRSNLNASSDLDVAGLLTLAAARGAGANVIVNVPSIDDRRVTDSLLSEVERRVHDVESAVARIHGQVRSGNLRPPEG